MRLEGFEHLTGKHCGSTALRAALRFRGLDLSEAMIFGLGAGVGFSLCDGDTAQTPPQASRLVLGRSGMFEQDLAEALGVDLELDVYASAGAALTRANELLAEGRPVLAYTDLFHLPYLGAHGHWFGHLVNLVGLDDGHATLSDNERPGLETVPLASFAPALGGAAPVRYSDDVTLLTLGSVRPLPAHALRRLAGHAIGLQAMRMSEESTETSGVIGLSTFAEEVRSWESRADWKRCLRLAGQAIELRGCGGGFFRRLYAEFLEEAIRLGEASAAPLVPLALASADAFTQLARELERAYQLETPRLAEAQERARRCVEAERALWAEATREPTPS